MRMIDFHSHGCWGIDDGVKDEQEALLFLSTAQRAGTRTLFCTPHMIPHGKYDTRQEEICEAVERLRKVALLNSIDMKIMMGSEFHLNEYSLEWFNNGLCVPYEGTNMLLVELDKNKTSQRAADDWMYEISRDNMRLMIAHPERYFTSIEEMFIQAKEWIKNGYYLQINRTSLLGLESPMVTKLAWKLVREGCVHIISSDAHRGAGKRVCRLDDVYDLLVAKIGKVKADVLFFENPKRIFRNEDLIMISRSPLTLWEFIYERFFMSK